MALNLQAVLLFECFIELNVLRVGFSGDTDKGLAEARFVRC